MTDHRMNKSISRKQYEIKAALLVKYAHKAVKVQVFDQYAKYWRVVTGFSLHNGKLTVFCMKRKGQARVLHFLSDEMISVRIDREKIAAPVYRIPVIGEVS